MAKRLVITEKPSVARDIVAVLGGFDEEEGYWENDDLVVTFAVGHLLELLPPEEIDEKYKRWTLDTLPIIPESFSLKPKSDSRTKERLGIIKLLLDREDVTGIINACDAGREGELIFREIVDYNEIDKPVERLWLQSMTDKAIKKGFETLKDGKDFMGLRAAAYCRTHADWLIGMNATRALTRRLKTRSENQAWSAGRVQTPTLAMLVKREVEILAHKPAAYWRIEAQFSHEGNVYQAGWLDPNHEADDEHQKPDRIFDKARADALVEKLTGQPGEASETRKPSKEAAPPLFDLTSLQREGNRRFGWSARRTLNAAQSCYERHKVLTYPRTDSRALPEDYREVMPEILEALTGDDNFKDGAQYLIDNGLLNDKRHFDDSKVSDHFAIIPTGVLPTQPLSGDDARIFDLVTRRFLAAFHPPAVWSRVERITTVEGETFRSRAKTLQFPGWRSVLGELEKDEEQSALPPLVAGEDQVDGVVVAGESLDLKEEETKPPPRISEARLLSLMENAGEQVEDEDHAEALKEKGIGTPATRADIIENLIRKGYATRSGKALRPSVKGIRLIDILERMHADRLASPALTGEMEQHLSEVEHNARDADDFMNEIRSYTAEVVELTKGFEFEDVYPDVDPLGPCPLCGTDVYERSWFYRCKEPPDLRQRMKERKEAQRKAKKKRKEGEPEVVIPEVNDCPFRIWKDKSGRYIDRTTAKELVNEGKTRVLDGFSTMQGRTYRGQLELEDGQIVLKAVAGGESDEQGAIPEYEVNETPLGQCPMCDDGEVIETRTTFLCTKGLAVLKRLERDEATIFQVKKRDIPEDMEYCPFIFPRTVCKREITRDEAEGYIREKKTPILYEFISRKGRPFTAILNLNEATGKHSFEFPPREGAGGGKKKATKKKAAKKTTKKKSTKKKATKKKAAKKTTKKKTAAKKKTTKKKTASKSSAKKKTAKKASKKKAASKSSAKKEAAEKDSAPDAAASADSAA